MTRDKAFFVKRHPYIFKIVILSEARDLLLPWGPTIQAHRRPSHSARHSPLPYIPRKDLLTIEVAWLEALVWPDEQRRLELLRAASKIARQDLAGMAGV